MRQIELGRGVARSVAALLAAAAMGLCAVPAAIAQLEESKQTEDQTVRDGAQTQEQIDRIDDERGELFRDYKAVMRELEQFRKYNQQQREVIADQEKQKESLREQIARVGEIDKDIVPLISDMLDGLEQFVSEDVPFLQEERQKRIKTLKDLMPNSSITVAEKFRRLLEAYTIENDYGRAIEAYEEKITGENGETRVLNYLKVGRVALFRQTPEFRETQMWDQANRQWVDLPGRYAEAVRLGRDMANDFVPPDLLVLPVIVPAQSAE